jgi:hypothetical protein
MEEAPREALKALGMEKTRRCFTNTIPTPPKMVAIDGETDNSYDPHLIITPAHLVDALPEVIEFAPGACFRPETVQVSSNGSW